MIVNVPSLVPLTLNTSRVPGKEPYKGRKSGKVLSRQRKGNYLKEIEFRFSHQDLDSDEFVKQLLDVLAQTKN